MIGHYRAVLFDLDGTLLNTLEDITDSMNEAMKRLNLGFVGINLIKALVGNGVGELVNGVLAQTGGAYSPEMKDRLLAEYRAVYDKQSAVKTKPYDGIPQMLDWLKGKGILTGVLSNKNHKNTLDVLQYYFPNHMFDFAAGYREGAPRKPDPAGVYEFCETLGLSAGEVLFAGDSEVDMETGRNAGIDCVGVLWGYRDEGVLTRCGAKALIKSPGELMKFFLQLK